MHPAVPLCVRAPGGWPKMLRSWPVGSALCAWFLSAAGCAAPAALTKDAGAAPAGSAGPPQLVCSSENGELVVAAADGRRQGALRVQPPLPLTALAAAGATLAGAGQGRLFVLLGTGADRHWQQVARWDPAQWNPEPLRAASYGNSALFWMRGQQPGTAPAALEVTAQGQVIKEAVPVAEQSLGGRWQSSYAPAGPYDPSFPEPLRLLAREARTFTARVQEELLHSERSPWGGRLTAPNLALPQRDDFADAPLFYVAPARDATPVALEYDDEPLLHRGLIGYGANAQLYFDGRFSRRGQGLLVLAPPGSAGQGGGKSARPLKARLIPGLRPPCAVIPADWHDGPPPPPAGAAAPASGAPRSS